MCCLEMRIVCLADGRGVGKRRFFKGILATLSGSAGRQFGEAWLFFAGDL